MALPPEVCIRGAGIVGRTLANYFDPRSGHFSDRVARLVAEDGELAGVIQRKVSDASRGIDDILANVKSVQTLNHMTVDVAPGTDRLRVTLNGADDGVNDVDLYLRFGAPATTTVFDFRSINDGVFDAVEVASPAAGTWHVLVHDFVGTDPDFQLTATKFQP